MVVRFLPRLPFAVLSAVLLVISGGGTLSEAAGPDFYHVIGVASGDTLNIRLGPSADHPVISELPYNANGIANLGCTGGLSLQAWTEASEEERQASKNSRWCLIGHDRIVGWVAGRFLSEGGAPDTFRAGQALRDLSGSEWRATWLEDQGLEHEVIVAFRKDGEIDGHAGCNRFNGHYSIKDELLTIGPLAITRKACSAELMKVEARFLKNLQNANSHVARHLVLVLLDAQSVVTVQFARTDWD